MDWKKLLNYLKNNPQYVELIGCFVTYKIDFKLGIEYSIEIEKDELIIKRNNSGWITYFFRVDLSPKEHAEAMVLYEDIKESFSTYHCNHINNFMTTVSSKPTSIEELNDDEE